jgi:hypothetical protein
VALRKSVTTKISGMANRRELTHEEAQEAAMLRGAWASYREKHTGATQEWLGSATGLGSQGAVGQYLRGVIPLNLPALLAFSKVLQVKPFVISPRLAKLIGNDSHGAGTWPFNFDPSRWAELPGAQRQRINCFALGVITEWEASKKKRA